MEDFDDGAAGGGSPQDPPPRLDEATMQRLRGVVRRHLTSGARGKIAESDIIQDVLMSLLLPRNRSLWGLSQELFDRRLNHHARLHASKAHRFLTQAKRDVKRESALPGAEEDAAGEGCEPEDSRELSTEDQASLNDFWDWLRTQVGETEYQVLQMSALGHGSAEISKELNLGRRWVDRVLERARKLLTSIVYGTEGE